MKLIEVFKKILVKKFFVILFVLVGLVIFVDAFVIGAE